MGSNRESQPSNHCSAYRCYTQRIEINSTTTTLLLQENTEFVKELHVVFVKCLWQSTKGGNLVLALTKRCSRGLGLHKRNPEHECWVQDTRHDQCGNYLQYGEAPGYDIVPVEAYRGPVEATKELFRICRLMWHTERIPPEIVRCMFVMQRNVKWGAVAEWVERRARIHESVIRRYDRS